MGLKYFCVTKILSLNLTSVHTHICHIFVSIDLDCDQNDPGPKRLAPNIR